MVSGKRGLYIPTVGDEIELAEDWTFRLFDEYRNGALVDAAGVNRPWQQDDVWQLSNDEMLARMEASPWRNADGKVIIPHWRGGDACIPLTLRAGTLLKIKRIYIRAGYPDFDSITFWSSRWVSQVGDPLFHKTPGLKSLRFWVKLSDANKLVFKEQV